MLDSQNTAQQDALTLTAELKTKIDETFAEIQGIKCVSRLASINLVSSRCKLAYVTGERES